LDSRYAELASGYNGFGCGGCDDLCCNGVFVHFTLIEHFYLAEGFRKLPPGKREDLLRRARQYNEAYSRVSSPEAKFRMPCPLNEDPLCLFYQYRPVLCRVYGLPGRLRAAGGRIQEFKGCWRFEKDRGSGKREYLDRTPYYSRLANLEKELREKLVYFQRYRKTVAQMLLDEKRPEALIMRTYDFFEGY